MDGSYFLATARIAVSVVAGGSGSGKSRLITQLRAGRPVGERWAWLGNSVGDADEAAHAAGAAGAAEAGELFQVTGGCACCLAGPAFRAALVRLLRAGPWQRLHIEVDAAGHAPAVVDQLRGPPFDQHLAVAQLLLTLNGREPLAGSADDPLSPAGRLGLASDFLLRASPSAEPSFAALLEAAPPWPRLERVAGRRLALGPSGLDEALDGWRVFSARLPAADAPDDGAILRRWPAEAIASRRPFKDLLSRLAADSGVSGFQALMRTERAWYRWAYGRGRGHGALAFDAGSSLVETETAWRLDNRLCVWLAPGARRAVVEAGIAGLGIALQDDDGPSFDSGVS
jgi:CobW/HypB/UreG, nucleotide-binding domain